MTGIERRVILWILRAIHHVLGDSIVEPCMHAAGWLWEVRRLLLSLLLGVVRAVLWLLRHTTLHHIHHAIILLLHLVRHSTMDKWLLGGVGVTTITLLVEKDTIVLCIRLCLRGMLLQILVAERLLA